MNGEFLECCVCDEDIEGTKTSTCELCHGDFHWDRCGGWYGGQHACSLCQDMAEKESLTTDRNYS